jgi:hypothetical protein
MLTNVTPELGESKTQIRTHGSRVAVDGTAEELLRSDQHWKQGCQIFIDLLTLSGDICIAFSLKTNGMINIQQDLSKNAIFSPLIWSKIFFKV